jgi:unconventional prefoldin RPB5 interactor 1
MADEALLTGKNVARVREVYEGRLLDLEGRLRQFQGFKEEYRALDATLAHMLTKARHQVMVPMGPKAFMPGHLKDTNSITVLLGDNYFAERSVKQAREIIRRRFAELKRLDTATRAEMGQFEGSLSTSEDVFKDGSGQVLAKTDKGTATAMGDGVVEIREDYDSEDEAANKGAPDRKKEPNWEELKALMDKSEAEEAQAEWAGSEGDAASITTTANDDTRGTTNAGSEKTTEEGGKIDVDDNEEESESGDGEEEEEEFDKLWQALGSASLEQRMAQATTPEPLGPQQESAVGMSPTNIRSPSDMYEFMRFAKEHAASESSEPSVKAAPTPAPTPAPTRAPVPASKSAPKDEVQPMIKERFFENPTASTTPTEDVLPEPKKAISAFKARRLAQR